MMLKASLTADGFVLNLQSAVNWQTNNERHQDEFAVTRVNNTFVAARSRSALFRRAWIIIRFRSEAEPQHMPLYCMPMDSRVCGVICLFMLCYSKLDEFVRGIDGAARALGWPEHWLTCFAYIYLHVYLLNVFKRKNWTFGVKMSVFKHFNRVCS